LSHSELNVNGPEIVIHSNSNKGPSYLRKSSKLSRSGYRFSQDYTQQNTSGNSKSVYFFESFFPKRANFESEFKKKQQYDFQFISPKTYSKENLF
jgi:hypothetical protein